MNPTVSIIIPVYNAAHYLDECITAITAQTFSDWELLLIDDGSTDDSAVIGRKWERLDVRIHYLYKTNGGVSSARNVGLDHATGRWIMFVDADDICHHQILESLLESLTKEDYNIVGCRIEHSNVSLQPKTQVQAEEYHGVLYDISSIYNCFSDAGILHPPFAKLYNNDLINRNKIRFIEGLSLGEDLCFNLDYLEHCTKGVFINQPLYYYRDTEGSLTKKIKGDYADIQMMLFDRKIEFLTRKSICHDFTTQAPGIVLDIFISECRSHAKLKDKIVAINKLKKHHLMKLAYGNSKGINRLLVFIIKHFL